VLNKEQRSASARGSGVSITAGSRSGIFYWVGSPFSMATALTTASRAAKGPGARKRWSSNSAARRSAKNSLT